VLKNAQDLIDAISEHGPMTAAELSGVLGTPRSSVYRLIEGLNSIGLTAFEADTRVSLTLRWLHLADAASAAMTEWSFARRVLRRLSDTTDQTFFLSIPRHDEALCIDWSQGRGIGILILKPGATLPLYAGAAGRLVLAHHEHLEDYLDRAPFPALTATTLRTAAALRRDVETTRLRGWVHSDEDVTQGIGALGVPLLSKSGTFRGCLTLGGRATEIRERKEELIERLTSAATEIQDFHDWR